MSQGRKLWVRWRVRASYPVAVVYWLLAKPSPRSILCGAILAAAGLGVRAAASGHLRKDRELAVTGPYAHTRNPLYFGSALMAAGFAAAGNSWPAAALVCTYFALFYFAVMRNEESDLRGRFGAALDEYAAHVPLFFPRVPGWRGPASVLDRDAPTAKFSWAQYCRNREYQALIGTIAGLGALWLRMWIGARLGH